MRRLDIETLLKNLCAGDKDAIIGGLRRSAATETRAGRDSWGVLLEGFASKIERRATYEPKLVSLMPNSSIKASLDAFQQRVPVRRLDEAILTHTLKKQIDGFLKEQRSQELLIEHELEPQNRVLLIGPPGSGKTLLAEIIALETGKSFHILQMGALMDSHLGNTIRNIENSFAAISQQDGVFLFDEFDALSNARGHTSDVNEMRRALNALLQCFENHRGASIVIAATNHPQSMDSAFRRRFDSIWETQDPEAPEREKIIETTCKKHKLPQKREIIEELTRLTEEMSFDECEDITKRLITNAVLTGKTSVDPSEMNTLARKKIGKLPEAKAPQNNKSS